LLGLAITDADRLGVRAHLETAARLNGFVDTAIIADEVEPAPVFVPETLEPRR
jgi:hypothetical protein